MENWVLLLLALLNLKLFAQGQPDSWIGIDCGSNRSTATNGILWQTDEDFIKTGTNYPIPDDSVTPLAILNTLRVFTEQNKNCYTLPASTMTRYFLRAFFFYANYDGLSNPPTFDLQIDGNKWVTVVSSSTEFNYYEILYWSQNPNISVCLARTQNNQFPFISSLEAWSIPDTMYTGMSQDLAWHNTYRYNYGPNNGIIWYPDDSYNRIWYPISVPGAVNTTADPGTSIYSHSDESPPDSAILDAIEAQDNGTSLFLYFNPVKTITPIFIEAYFTETKSDVISDTRSFDMYVEDKSLAVKPEYSTCTAEVALVQASTSNLTIELRPTETTSLPPIISAIEVYTASDPLVTTGTDENDTDGLAAFTSTFDQLKGWSGEPCLPANSVWQWLGCTGSDPPRVTSLNLSGYGLSGALPDFRQMQALEDIDLSKNRLSGQIPEFLGQLPNLKKLNLSNNDFSGELPSSICTNTRLTYNVIGNRIGTCNPTTSPPPSPPPSPGKSSKSSAVGPAVGASLAVIIVILVVVFFVIRRLANPGNNQPTGPGIGNGTGQESFMTSASTEQLIRPPPRPNAPMEPTAEEDDDDCIPVSMLDVHVKPNKQQSMVPEMDLDELEELVGQQANVESFDRADELTSDEECVAVGEYGANASSDQSMVPDLDLEELDEIINHEKEKKGANEVAGNKADV